MGWCRFTMRSFVGVHRIGGTIPMDETSLRTP
jgi:hypothetical protein